LREMVLEVYDQIVGLDMADVAVDGCITKAPCGGEKAGRSPVDRGKAGHQTLNGGGCARHPARHRHRPGQPSRLAAALTETLHTVSETLGELPERAKVHLGTVPTTRRPPASGYNSVGCSPRSPRRVKAGSANGHEALGRRAYQLVAQRPQEARMVYGASGAGDRLLGRLLRCNHHREETHPRSLDPLALGGSTSSPTVTYWRKLLFLRP
jgi:hypothetical protein